MFNIQQTNESRSIASLQTMNACAQSAFNSLKEYSEAAHTHFWYGEGTPELKIQLLGTAALDVFTRSTKVQAFLKEIDPNHVELGVPAGYSIIWNEDGSASLETSN